jgi:putative flippase GtrA
MTELVLKLLSSQVIRYGFVGIFNTVFSYGLYAFILCLGYRFEIASLVSIMAGIVFSFITQGFVVFKGVGVVSFVRYLVTWCGLYFLNIWLIQLLINIPLDAYLAGALATVPVVLLAYFVMKYFVFQSGNG